MQSGFMPELDYSTASIRTYLDAGYTLEEAVLLWEKAFLDEVNRVRAEHGIRPLEHDYRLHAAARDHSEDVATRDIPPSHFGSDGSTEFDRARRRGWDGGVRENVFSNASITASPQYAVQKFYDSPPHRDTMLMHGMNPERMYTGVGVYVKGNGMVVTHKLGSIR